MGRGSRITGITGEIVVVGSKALLEGFWGERVGPQVLLERFWGEEVGSQAFLDGFW